VDFGLNSRGADRQGHYLAVIFDELIERKKGRKKKLSRSISINKCPFELTHPKYTRHAKPHPETFSAPGQAS